MKTLVLFHNSYLAISETFIYRQWQGLQEEFKILPFCVSLKNQDVYIGFNPVKLEEKNLFQKIYLKITGESYTQGQLVALKNALNHADALLVEFGHVACALHSLVKGGGKPVIPFFWGLDAYSWLEDEKNSKKFSVLPFRAIFCNSEIMKKRLLTFNPVTRDIHVVYNGIDPQKYNYRDRSTDSFRGQFIQISRLVEKKGIPVTLRVFSRYVKEVNSEAHFTLIGDGPMKKTILNLIQELKIQRHVTLLDSVPFSEVPQYLDKADIFLHHSITSENGDREGIPTILMEAMASGLPVVSTLHSGIPELVENNKSGFLVNEKDEDSYFTALASMGKFDLQHICQTARAKVMDKFDIKKCNTRLIEILHQLIE